MSKSTSISDLPINNSNDVDNSDEAMMVNSILQEIEQEDESLNDENLDSLNYVGGYFTSTTQDNEIPTPEMIKSVTQEIFEPKQVIPPVESREEPKKEEQEQIRKVLEDKEPKKETHKLSMLKDIDGILKKKK